MCFLSLAALCSPKVTQLVKVSPLWSASWVSAVDKSRNSKSAEGRGIWEIYDNCLQFVLVSHALAVRDALDGADVHLTWRVWSTAAEAALASAFGMAGGPALQGLVLGRVARLRVSNIGGKRVGKFRPDLRDPPKCY